MNDKRKNLPEELYGTILNGRQDFARNAKNLLARKQVTYYNSKTHKMQTQSYFDMQDLVIPVMLRKNKEGQIEFAMMYEYIPAVNKVFLELPECPFFRIKKSHYDNADVTEVLDDRMIDLGLDMVGFKYLDSSETAVSQSFTDQQAKFVVVSVEEENENNQLKWFPITSIKSYFENIGNNSSLQTKYALELFYNQYKKYINSSNPTQFVYDKEIVGKTVGNWKDVRTIMEHKHRFGIKLAKNMQEPHIDDNITSFGQFAEYGTSKNSSNCLVIKKCNGKIMIGLSKQQRSPFVEREGMDEYFYEFVGGMVEDGESFEETARRETLEETGVDIQHMKLIHIEEPTLASKAAEEYGDFYLCEITEQTKINSLTLDEQEDIDRLEWFDLYETDFGKMRIPLGTKYIIQKAREYYQVQRQRSMEERYNQVMYIIIIKKSRFNRDF